MKLLKKKKKDPITLYVAVPPGDTLLLSFLSFNVLEFTFKWNKNRKELVPSSKLLHALFLHLPCIKVS